jgi:hypothetical protein
MKIITIYPGILDKMNYVYDRFKKKSCIGYNSGIDNSKLLTILLEETNIPTDVYHIICQYLGSHNVEEQYWIKNNNEKFYYYITDDDDLRYDLKTFNIKKYSDDTYWILTGRNDFVNNLKKGIANIDNRKKRKQLEERQQKCGVYTYNIDDLYKSYKNTKFKGINVNKLKSFVDQRRFSIF